MNQDKKYAIICSGGNAPGMATCVTVFVRKCLANNIKPVAFADGFEGLHNDMFIELSSFYGQLFVEDGSALIGASRAPRFKNEEQYRKECVEVLKKHEVDALVVVGGEGSIKGAYELSKLGVRVITIPATIDNDVPSTSYTVGFDTCLNTISDSISKINDVFISHRGVAIIELMGRTCPDLTIRSGIANNATFMVTKYSKLRKADFLRIAQEGFVKGKRNITFLVTEQLYPKDGPRCLKEIARFIEKETGFMSRHIEIGYAQRGGKPSARDKMLANYMINVGIDQLLQGKSSMAVCRKSRATVAIDLTKAISMKRKNGNRELVRIFNKINQE